MHKSYFAVIPANVRYDKNLPPNAKLLYGEITALSNEKGYCWAKNDYFAQLYGTTKVTVSRWIKALSDAGYITTKLIYKEGTKEIAHRYIWITHDVLKEPNNNFVNTPYQNVEEPINKNVNGGIIKNVKDNNTLINNTINNTSNNKYIVEQAQLCIPFKEIIDYLNQQAGKKFRHSTADTQKFIKARWNQGFTDIEDYKTVIDNKVADWINTEWDKYLRPKTLFGTNFQDYLNEKKKVSKTTNNKKSLFTPSAETLRKQESIEVDLEKLAKLEEELPF